MTDEPIDPLAQQASLLDQWVEVRREINALEARAAKLLGERLTLLDEDVALFPAQRKTINRSMINEYAAGGRITKGSIEYAFEDARMLAEFPTLMEHFLAGSITAAHVRHIVRAAASIQTGIHDGSVEPAVLGLSEQAALEFAVRVPDAHERARERAGRGSRSSGRRRPEPTRRERASHLDALLRRRRQHPAHDPSDGEGRGDPRPHPRDRERSTRGQ